MKPITAEQLAEHVVRFDASDEQDRDELLRDLLVHTYPTKVTQDN
jgi:uroporphyrinogen-III synthase